MQQPYTTRHGRPDPHSISRGLACRALSYLLLLLCAAITGGNTPAVTHAQQGENHAGLVVQFGDGTTNTYCIPFTGETITGLDLLLKSGLDVIAETQGALGGWVCKIGPEGCNFPEQACVCQSYGPGGKYWVYNHLRDGAWKFSSLGASSYKVRNGEVDGWAWSSGKGPSVTPSFAELCAAVLPAQPEPTATTAPPPPPAPTNTPLPPPTNTPMMVPPTITPPPPAPTATRRPQVTPTPAAIPPTEQMPQPPQPSATPEPPPTTAPPTYTPTLLPTNTPTPTVAPTDTHTPTPVPTSTHTTVATSTTVPTPTATPTAIVLAAGPSAQAFTQIMALGIGLAVIGGLGLWWFGLRGRRGYAG
ncbi:MAG: hypothetical protein M3437_15280 [Chloroflexota bacterium]|nr:hypothetical protein [Chloroflexota bacterium]